MSPCRIKRRSVQTVLADKCHYLGAIYKLTLIDNLKELQMNKKILIPTDFSKNAWNAVTYAADLFKDTACTFYLLNAYKTTVHSRRDLVMENPADLSFEIEKTNSENGLAKILEMLNLRTKNKNHSYISISLLDDPISATKKTIEKKDIGLVVMGTKGSNNKVNMLLGSNTINAMENLRSCPILGIPLDARLDTIKEIVLPTSYKTHFKRKELINLVEIAQLRNATVRVLHMSKNEELSIDLQENQQLLEECLEGASYTFHYVSGTDVPAAVQVFVESRDSDMVAFINKKHGFFDNLFTKPLVSALGKFSKVPLLVMHDTRD
jgi:nucleotide-binding universal stress UspA family protein